MESTLNTYLTNEDVLERTVAWETYLTARLISERDLQLIRRFDKSPDTAKASSLEESGPAFVEAFMTVLRNVTKEETTQYVLAMLDELMMADPSKVALLHAASTAHPGSVTQPAVVFARLLVRPDWFTQEKAAKLLQLTLESSPKRDPAVESQFFEWLTTQLRRPTAGERSLLVASGALAGLLKRRQQRAEFANGVNLLVTVLKSAVLSTSSMRSQILYQTGLCLWQMSFEAEALDQMEGGEAVGALVELLKGGNKEKVMRIAMLTLRNLMATGDQALLAQMIDAGLPRLVKIRSAQSWADEDVLGLLEAMDERLTESLVELSSLEKYRQEVLSGALEWTPMHTSRAFWQENAANFEDKDFQLLRCLIKLLDTCREARPLAVACHDLGMFADTHQHGRFIINDLGGKQAVMRLMAHPDADVQKHALLCVQRLMLGRDKLDFLRRPAGASGVQA